jgi:hypothetical protein
MADGRCVKTICEIVLAISPMRQQADNSAVLMGPILLAIAEANMFEVAANANVTDIQSTQESRCRMELIINKIGDQGAKPDVSHAPAVMKEE